jgi:hypothetical protein
MTNATTFATIDGTDYVLAGPSTDAAQFVVVARPEAGDDYRLAATSKTFPNATKRARELTGKRYGWNRAVVCIAAA